MENSSLLSENMINLEEEFSTKQSPTKKENTIKIGAVT
jgi:hypothetical protein